MFFGRVPAKISHRIQFFGIMQHNNPWSSRGVVCPKGDNALLNVIGAVDWPSQFAL
jgi:hypothetical protein